MDIAFDMETSDPDDVMTLCFLAGHPQVKLRAVTVTPGSRSQIGLVRNVLDRMRVDVTVGAKNPDHPKECVSAFHHKWLGIPPKAEPDGIGWEVLSAACAAYPSISVVTGGPLSNLGAMIANGKERKIGQLVIQGGFAGDSVTSPEHRLAKFAGRETAPTFNLNGDVKAAFAALNYDGAKIRRLVSKNVCHGVVYDRSMHERMQKFSDVSSGIKLMIQGMEEYLKHKPEGKIFHDPLAACVALDPTVCGFREIEMYREKGEWGSRLKDGTRTWISVSVDKKAFEEVLSGQRGGMMDSAP